MRKRKYWYKFFVGECPVCGRDACYKQRVYGERPKDPQLRYIHLNEQDTYCGCL